MSSSPPPSTIQDPPTFSTLPLELRLKIYTYLLPPPRILSIRYSPTHKHYYSRLTTPSSSFSAQQNNHIPPHLSHNAPPLLLHLSPLSRSFFLTHYPLLTFSPSIYTSTIYLSPVHDTLLFDNLECSPDGDLGKNLRECNLKEEIRNVAFEVGFWEVLRVFRHDCLWEVGALEGLRGVSLVLRRDSDVESDDPGVSISTGTGLRTSSSTGTRGAGTMNQRDIWYGHGINITGMGIPHILLEPDIPNSPAAAAGNTLAVRSRDQEIRHAYFYVQFLRSELEINEVGVQWKEGRSPNVQLWLW